MGTTRAGNISPDSETAFNFDRLMHRIFDATQTNDGTFMSAESNRASNEQEKWSIEGDKKEKDEEKEATAALVELGESQREAREEAERARIKAWDEAPSLDYPGLTNAQVLSGLRTICANLPAYTNRAVQNGWIKPEEENEFAAYMRRELWLKEQQRLGHTNTPEYIAAQHQQDQANQQHPGWHGHAQNMVKEVGGWENNADKNYRPTDTAVGNGLATTNARLNNFDGTDHDADVASALDYINRHREKPDIKDIVDINRHPFDRTTSDLRSYTEPLRINLDEPHKQRDWSEQGFQSARNNLLESAIKADPNIRPTDPFNHAANGNNAGLNEPAMPTVMAEQSERPQVASTVQITQNVGML